MSRQGGPARAAGRLQLLRDSGLSGEARLLRVPFHLLN